MLIKQLAHTGGLTITGKKELIFFSYQYCYIRAAMS